MREEILFRESPDYMKGQTYPPQINDHPCDPDFQCLLEQHFPIKEISSSCVREKSIRQGHISTLQLWWARRPLAVCRAAIFAALMPGPDSFEKRSTFLPLLNQVIPGEAAPTQKLLDFIATLAEWESSNDQGVLEQARQLIAAGYREPPIVVDTFAGGGSFPLEAARLGLDAYASDLNPVAVTALMAALELLPRAGTAVLKHYKTVCTSILDRLSEMTSGLYGHTREQKVLAYFWCRTYECPKCQIEVPLLHDRLLASSTRRVILNLCPEERERRFRFEIVSDPNQQQWKAAVKGTVNASGAHCPQCGHHVPTKWLQDYSSHTGMGERLYAKRLRTIQGDIRYESCSRADQLLASQSQLRPLRNRHQGRVPAEPLDVNGVRHLWAIQYGICSTADLFNQRQGIALLEVLYEIQAAMECLDIESTASVDHLTLRVLLSLTLNRLVMYNSRHAWWQPHGEFPANMFVRQAIPMVWNYVEIPIDSPMAGGFPSAAQWIARVGEHCARLPRPAQVCQRDAAVTELENASVDLVTLDPPYYDSVVYAYLADVFYVWMKPLLGGAFPNLFSDPVTPKVEEAIVDRRHRLATAPKGDAHFRRKMREAFREARRILKPTGRLLLMFGHKKLKAWDAIVSELLHTGFMPIASWPIHTERKAKFRHGYVAALSTSCLIICIPQEIKYGGIVGWEEFKNEIRHLIETDITRYKENHLYGSDLLAALFIPILLTYKRYKYIEEDNKAITIEVLFKRLPSIIMDVEMKTVLEDETLKNYPKSQRWLNELMKAYKSSDNENSCRRDGDWLKESEMDELMRAAKSYSDALLEGSPKEADRLWGSLRLSEQEAVTRLYQAVCLLSEETSRIRQRVDASLGRISMLQRGSRYKNGDAQIGLGNDYGW